MRLKVACVQMPHGGTLEANLATASRLVAEAVSGGARLALLPEYFFATGPPETALGHAPRIARALSDLSREHGIVVAGNVVGGEAHRLVNELLVHEAGVLVARQPKIHPMPREAEAGMVGGTGFDTFPLAGVSAGALVCADIFYPEASRVLSLAGAEILLNPVMSPHYEPDPTRAAREAVYVARAWDAGAFVLKAGGFRRAQAPDGPAIAGRSLIAAPWGLLARYKDDFAEEVLTADLDFNALREFRKKHRGFVGRVPNAYASLVAEREG